MDNPHLGPQSAPAALAVWRRRIRAAVLCTWALLLLLVWGWTLASEFSTTRAAWALLYSLPLWAPLPGLWRGRRYTHAWATLCVLPYLIVGLTESIANAAAQPWAGPMLLAGLLFFTALIAYLRVSRPLGDAHAQD